MKGNDKYINKTIARTDNDSITNAVRYQYDNYLGSASLELDENADIISYEEYHLSQLTKPLAKSYLLAPPPTAAAKTMQKFP